jgi:hypothetical protein
MSRFTGAPNPDTPPDSYDPTGVCARCGLVSNFRNLGNVPVTFDMKVGAVGRDGSWTPLVLERASALQCMGCGQATVAVEEEWVGGRPPRDGRRSGDITFRGIHWWPVAGAANLDASIPSEVADCLMTVRDGWPIGVPPCRMRNLLSLMMTVTTLPRCTWPE